MQIQLNPVIAVCSFVAEEVRGMHVIGDHNIGVAIVKEISEGRAAGGPGLAEHIAGLLGDIHELSSQVFQ